MTSCRFALLPALLFALTASTAFGQGFSPDDAVKRMTVANGFTVVPVATEPAIRQPLSMSFDERGRLWVLQYLQYPNPAGLRAVKQDQYLRTVWDRVPEPPPRGPKGADRITILYDPDERGVYRKNKDFVSGLNITGGFCVGQGGVFVVQPPYLLYYADKNQDDVPDGDPEVLLTGFGMDDTHSLANSLQWGPDGWLYGAAGSTSTCSIKNPAGKPTDPPIEFQQGIWRYHPKTKVFELFSEGGGNTYGLDFDKYGNAIAGTNYGGSAMLHQMQGAYHVKGFSKHGPLHNPHAYGYFQHVPYTGFKGGHVTCGGVVYQADAYPPEFRDQYIAGNLLSNAVYWHIMERSGSTFKAKHGGDVIEANDTWFRPVDLMQGPDGSVYVADWYDKRAAHLDPVDTWDRTNGRIYKIEYTKAPKVAPFDLRDKTGRELVALLSHPNKWFRNEARRLLAERQDKSVIPQLTEMVKSQPEPLALEALWALYAVGGFTEEFARELGLCQTGVHVRAWTVRLLGETPGKPVEAATLASLQLLAAKDPSIEVRSQLACTAKRLPAEQGLALIGEMLARNTDAADPFIPMLMWWAVESKVGPDSSAVLRELLARKASWNTSIGKGILERLARRIVSDDTVPWADAIALFDATEEAAVREVLWSGVEAAIQGRSTELPTGLRTSLIATAKKSARTPTVTRILVRLGDADERAAVLKLVADAAKPDAERLKSLELLTQVKSPELPDMLPKLLAEAKSDAFRIGVLGALEAIDNPKTAELVLAAYPKWSAGVQRRAVTLLTSRPAWALALLKAVDAGTFPKASLTVDTVRPVVALNDAAVTKLAEKHWGKIGPATAGEKQARISYLNLVLNRHGLGDAKEGKAIFTKQCSACHQLFGEGGKIGPDLTTADRKNRGYMLMHIVDPSFYIRPEFVSYKLDTLDGRALTGLITESTGESVAVTNVVNNLVQKSVVPKKDIDAMTPSSVSIMPEKLLDTLSETEVRHLFAFLLSDAAAAPKPAPAKDEKPAPQKKLKVVLISGSLEYKSDESLAAFQTYLEKNYPVECVRAFRKSDTDIPGLEALATCDAAIFFTRRLKPSDEQLALIKKYIDSGKPVVGVRTASHGFQNWLEMDKIVLGGNYLGHFGHNVKAEVAIVPAAKDHPILKDVKPFVTIGGLYKNPDIAKDVTVLLTGTSVQGHSEPAAWVRERKLDGGKTQRVFYTSLGTPEDFTDANFQKLLANGVMWSVK